MSKAILLLLLFNSNMWGHQPQYTIQKAWLFSVNQSMGNVPVDLNGKQQKSYYNIITCFIAIKRNGDMPMPVWQTALFNGTQYAVTVIKCNADSTLVGNDKNTGTPINIKSPAGCRLLQLVLTDKGKIADATPGIFKLLGVLNKRKVSFNTHIPVIELTPIPMP